MIFDASGAAGKDILWDTSAFSMIFYDGTLLKFGTDLDWTVVCSTAKQLQLTPVTTDESSSVLIGADTVGADLKLFGATTGKYFLWDASADGAIVAGTITRSAQQYVQTISYCKVGATAGWVIPAAADAAHLATLPQSQSASTLVIPITIPLKVGWTITAWTINGQIDSAGNAATLDGKLYKHTEATAGFANAAIGSGMTQLSKTADYKVADGEASLTEVVAADESYYLLWATTLTPV